MPQVQKFDWGLVLKPRAMRLFADSKIMLKDAQLRASVSHFRVPEGIVSWFYKSRQQRFFRARDIKNELKTVGTSEVLLNLVCGRVSNRIETTFL